MELNTIILIILTILMVVSILFNQKYFNKTAIIIALLFGIIITQTKGLRWFLILFTFLIISILATHINSKIKGVHHSSRETDNVLSNGLVPLMSAIYSIKNNDPIFFLIYLGSISAALADTISSEIGMLSKKDPIMITTLKKTKSGENGGISILGFIAAITSCTILAIITYILFDINYTIFIAIIISGLIGTIIDSILGATLENKNKITNGSVNFITTLFGGIILVVITLLL
ncbi:MAG: DUF92 domain-containing protein [DPANN group archaeon]|nr:DUF92 domain-containing protein [DPANN group archaeon]